MSSPGSGEQNGEDEDSVEKVLEKNILEIQVRMAQEIRSQLALGREKVWKRLVKTQDKFATAFRIMERQEKNIEEASGKLETISSRLDLVVREQKQLSKDFYSVEQLLRSRYTRDRNKDYSSGDFSKKGRPECRNFDKNLLGNRIPRNASSADPTKEDQRIGDQTSGWTQRGGGIFTSEDSDSGESDLE